MTLTIKKGHLNWYLVCDGEDIMKSNDPERIMYYMNELNQKFNHKTLGVLS